MTDDPLDEPITVTLTVGQIYAIKDIIADCLDHTPKPSVAATHHSGRLRAADENLTKAILDDMGIRKDIHDD